MRRPSGDTIRSMIRITCSLLSNATGTRMNFAFALDVDILCAINHYFSDGFIFKQRLERTETQDFCRDLFKQAGTFGPGKDDILFTQDLFK